MKTQRQLIIHELMPALNQIGQMQKQGSLMLNQKVGYALSRAVTAIIKMKKDSDVFQKSQMDKFVEVVGDQYQTVDEGNQKKWKFKSEADEIAFVTAMNEYNEQEVDWNPMKISNDDLKQVHNIPIDILAMLDAYELTTDLAIAQPKLSIIK